MVALSEKWSPKGSIGVKNIQVDQAQVVVSTNQKKKKPTPQSTMQFPSFARLLCCIEKILNR